MKNDLMSRRGLLGTAAALGTLGTGSFFVPKAFAQAKKGGRMKVGVAGGASTDSFNPATYSDSVPIFQGYTLMNGLIEIDEHNRPIPELLESWEVSKNASEWVFNVRKGVTFHNGKTLDADDMLYSLNLHRGKDTKSGAASLLKPVTEISKLSSHQIKITLSAPDSDFLYTLGDFHLLAVPNGFSDWQNPIGTGAFTLVEYEPGLRMIAKRFPGYWKADRGHLDEIEMLVINDTAARMNALFTGQVDVISRVDVKTITLIENAPQLKINRAPGGWHAIMAMQTDQAPYADPNLRLALRHAIDRKQILDTLFSGYGSLGNDHPIPRGDPYYNTELAQIGYDPDKAKFHMKKAGLDRLDVTLSTSDATFAGAVDTAVLYQEAAKKAGININIKREAADGFWNNVWLKAPFCLSYWAGRAAATQMLQVAYHSAASWNETHWRNPEFDQLLAQARSEIDETKKKAHVWEMQRILHDEGGALIPVFADWVDAAHKKVQGLTPHGIANLDNQRLAEKGWIAA